jgi:hypothetical protein
MTMTTTIKVPMSCAALCTRLAELTQRIDDELAQAGNGAAIDYGALEQRVADALGEVERGLHAQVLARLDIDVPAIRVWGDEYRRIGRFESDYHTLAGTVRVMRTVYRKAGRNGDTLDPVSVRAGVVADGWLPHTARAMAHLLAQGTSREAEATGRELARLPYSRSSFERVGHEVGTLYRRAQARIEEVLIQEYAVPAEARSVSISIDRVALPMEEPIAAPPHAAEYLGAAARVLEVKRKAKPGQFRRWRHVLKHDRRRGAAAARAAAERPLGAGGSARHQAARQARADRGRCLRGDVDQDCAGHRRPGSARRRVADARTTGRRSPKRLRPGSAP